MKSTNIELILAYFEELEKQKFFGTVEITLQAGKLAYSRELKSVQDFEIAALSWRTLPEDVKLNLRDQFKGNEKFKKLIEKK